jgi:hypothetical protein
VRGPLVAIAGIGLVPPAVGVEAFAMPVIGGRYLAGGHDVAPAVGEIYRGPMTLGLLAGLLLLAVGAVDLARVGWRNGLPRWAIVAFTAGLCFWLPLLPRTVRVADGLLIGLGGLGLARALWRDATGRRGVKAAGEPGGGPGSP